MQLNELNNEVMCKMNSKFKVNSLVAKKSLKEEDQFSGNTIWNN